MNPVAIKGGAESRARLDLKEALREIHLTSGLSIDRRRREGMAIGVTSAHFGDGKTTVAIGLAASLATDFNADVTLVDGDFHTTSIGSEYGLASSEGLVDVLLGEQELGGVSHRVNSHITVIPAGRPSQDPARTARSESLGTLIDNMKRTSKFVVIDLPATLHSMSAPVLARRCDGVIVVVRSGKTTRRDLERVLQLLKDVKVLGVVMNRRKSVVPRWIEQTLNLGS
ncbi:MAG: CpsD/CapB family tyrosine-protein kinase [Dehalococcoidia bacterium]|nr:CpsD/CapB family tyrosine-protein kinase [Dehalococcoidia bacterium]